MLSIITSIEGRFSLIAQNSISSYVLSSPRCIFEKFTDSCTKILTPPFFYVSYKNWQEDYNAL
jgi:hypothetical protein